MLTPPDPNATAPRYTTVLLVKERLGVEPTDTSRDDQITAAIVASEWSIDTYLGRAFPDTEDPDDPAVVTIVPSAVSEAALALSVWQWKQADSISGGYGGDGFGFGGTDVTAITRWIVQRAPQLVGFKVSFGVG